MRTRASAGYCERGTDLRGMEEGLALAGSVVMLNLYRQRSRDRGVRVSACVDIPALT